MQIFNCIDLFRFICQDTDLSSQSGSEHAVVVHPSVLTREDLCVHGAVQAQQNLILRLREHLTGAQSPVLFRGNADSQQLLLCQIPEDIFQSGDVAVVRGDGCHEIVEQKVTGKSDPGEELDEE